MGADVAAEEQFGPYLVYERLGVGGMATVHRALERGIEGFERIVALKRLLPHLAADASFIKSFVREAKLASLLNHVNIVRIFELGRVGTQYFISMEYIDGSDIRRILRHARKVSGPPPIHVTVGLLLQLCEALDYAHTKVDDDGHLKVIDFGVAKTTAGKFTTHTGLVKGKLGYMSVEAIGGKHVDLRADIFSTGVVLWELLSGRRLFRGNNEIEVIVQIQRGVVPPASTYHDDCPVELDRVIARALARDPDERFASAGELRDELCDLRRYYEDDAHEGAVVDWIAMLRAGAVAQRRVDTSEEATELHLADDDLVEVPPALAEGSRRAEPYDVDIEIEPPRVAPEPRNPRFIESDTVINEDTLDSDDH